MASRCVSKASLVALGLILQACSPTMNWREARLDGAPVLALFPCRPDQGVQSVVLGELAVKMTMMGCEAGGAMFTFAQVDLEGAGNGEDVIALWQSGTLGSMKGVLSEQTPFVLKKASPHPAPRQISASGRRPDGSVVALRAAWFEVNGAVYQVAVYADRDNDEVTQAYFEGIRVE